MLVAEVLYGGAGGLGGDGAGLLARGRMGQDLPRDGLVLVATVYISDDRANQ